MSDQDLADKILNEFDRIGVSINQDSSSGLMVESQGFVLKDFPEALVVKISDGSGSTSGLYDGKEILDLISGLKEASFTPDTANNIWSVIREFEFY